jgi:hypothetical protein
MRAPVLHRVQPDRPPGPKIDEGIHAWPIGSFMPMGFYRPVPIVRFTGLIVLQSAIDVALVAVLAGFPGVVTLGAGTVVALVLLRRAWRRWLATASHGWKVATVVALGLNLALVALASFSPSRLDPLVDCAVYPELTPVCGPEPVLRPHFRPGETLALGVERVVPGLLVDEDLLGQRQQRLVGKQPGGEAVSAERQVMVEQAAAAGAAEAALGPFGRAVADDAVLAGELDLGAAHHPDEGDPAPAPAHRAVARLDVAPRGRDPHSHRAAQTLPLDPLRFVGHTRLRSPPSRA